MLKAPHRRTPGFWALGVLLAASIGLEAQAVRKLDIKTSPTPEVSLAPFDPSAFPAFKGVFDHRTAALAPASFVVSNGSGRTIIGIGIKWRIVDSAGHEMTYTNRTHSFLVPSLRPLALAHGRLLASPQTFVNEDVLLHPVGGVMAFQPTDATINQFSGAVAINAEVDSIIFEDGEVAGPDDLGLVKAIRNRRDAAVEVVKQVEDAQAQGKDPREVLRTIGTNPSPDDWPVARVERQFASELLHLLHTQQFDFHLQTLKGIPAPPLFYRKDTGPIWR